MPRKRVTSVRLDTARRTVHEFRLQTGFDGCLRTLCAHVGIKSAQALSERSCLPARRVKSWWLGQRLPDRGGMAALRAALRTAFEALPNVGLDREYYDLVRRLEVEWTARAHRGLGHPIAVHELPQEAMRWEAFVRRLADDDAPDVFILLDNRSRDPNDDVYLPRIFVRTSKLAQQPHCIVHFRSGIYLAVQYQFTTGNRSITLFRDGRCIGDVPLSDAIVLYVESDIRVSADAGKRNAR